MNKLIAFFTFLLAAALACAALAIVFPKPLLALYIARLERETGLYIDFKADDVSLFKASRFRDVSIRSELGYRLDINEISVYPPFFSLRNREKYINCEARGIKFQKEIPVLNVAFELLSMPKLKDMAFEALSVDITVKRDKILMDNLKLSGRFIRISGSGVSDIKEGSIDYRLKFLFADNLTDGIPDAVKSVMLTKEAGPWMSFSADIGGNYRAPQLNLKSMFLDLGIKALRIK